MIMGGEVYIDQWSSLKIFDSSLILMIIQFLSGMFLLSTVVGQNCPATSNHQTPMTRCPRLESAAWNMYPRIPQNGKPSRKKFLFGTIDPNVGAWDRVNPNFYKSLFLWHIRPPFEFPKYIVSIVKSCLSGISGARQSKLCEFYIYWHQRKGSMRPRFPDAV